LWRCHAYRWQGYATPPLGKDAPLAYTLRVVIVETRLFTTRVVELLSAEEYRRLQNELICRPTMGAVMRGTGGLRKLRWSVSGRGKRGGVRIIYFCHALSSRLLMLSLYSKNEQVDLTADQRKALRKVVQQEYS
jgi:hypothetical protein